jgi:hypothetical protein
LWIGFAYPTDSHRLNTLGKDTANRANVKKTGAFHSWAEKALQALMFHLGCWTLVRMLETPPSELPLCSPESLRSNIERRPKENPLHPAEGSKTLKLTLSRKHRQ